MEDYSRVKLIVGNGFDIHCGLKTKYSDFFESNIFNKTAIERWINSELAYIAQSNGHLSSIDIDEPSFNIWSLFFYLCSSNIANAPTKEYYANPSEIEQAVKESNSNGLINWCDIEIAMKISLLTKLTGADRPILPNECKVPLWTNIESAINAYTPTLQTMGSLSDKEKILFVFMIQQKPRWANKPFFTYLLDELKLFETSFGRYIGRELSISSSDFRVYMLIKQIISSDSKPTQEDLASHPINVDSFNYSNPFGNMAIVHHINGDTDKPIFGIDSRTLKPTNPAYIFTKTYRRLEYNDAGLSLDPFMHFDDLYVYGHSLSEQDYSYFFPLFDYMGLDDISRTTKVVFAYNNYGVNGKMDDQSQTIILNQLSKNVAGLFEAYETYRNKTEEHRLIDNLSFQRRLVLKLI